MSTTNIDTPHMAPNDTTLAHTSPATSGPGDAPLDPWGDELDGQMALPLTSSPTAPEEPSPNWTYRAIAAAIILGTLAIGALLWLFNDDDPEPAVLGTGSDTAVPVSFADDAAVEILPADALPEIDGTDLSKSIEVIEATWTTSPLGGTDLLFLYRNTADVAFTDMKLQIEVFGENDELVATEIATAAILPPGRTFAASRVIAAGADSIRFFRLTATAESQVDAADGYWIDVDRWTAEDGRIDVRGRVTAAFDRPPEEVVVLGVYRDNDGKFAGSSFTVAPGSTEPQEFVASSWPNRAIFGVEVYIAS